MREGRQRQPCAAMSLRCLGGGGPAATAGGDPAPLSSAAQGKQAKADGPVPGQQLNQPMNESNCCPGTRPDNLDARRRKGAFIKKAKKNNLLKSAP